MSQTFRDPNKWLIRKGWGMWRVNPPPGSFWGAYTEHATGEEALADFRRQMAPPPGFPKVALGAGLVEDWHGKATNR